MNTVAKVLFLVCTFFVTTAQMQMPIPQEYDKPYTGKLTILRYPFAEVHEHCAGAPNTPLRFRTHACAMYMGSDRCHLNMPEEGSYSENFMVYLMRHELAHCNGWIHK